MLRDPRCTVDGGDESLRLLMSPLAVHSSVYHYSPRKRFRHCVPPQAEEDAEDHDNDLYSPISILPDECLFEILRRLADQNDRESVCCVSRCWLKVLSSVRSYDVLNRAIENVKENDGKQIPVGDRCVTRCLEGKEASDVRLAVATVRANVFGGMTKIMIQGGRGSRATDAGLTILAQGSPSLKSISIWNAAFIGDDGLYEVAKFCPLLERLDLCKCPLISDKGLIAIAEKCPYLSFLVVEYCPKIRNEGFQAVGRFCPNLQSISIVGCPFVGDQGVASLVSSASSSLMRIKLQHLNITDVSLAVIGQYGRVVTDLVLVSLQNVNERGFWVMGNAQGLQNLKFATITACRGATDVGVRALAKGCPSLKKLYLRQCCYLSDVGLRAFAETAKSVESLELEECNRISLVGVVSALLNCKSKIKGLALVKCLGIKDIDYCWRPLAFCTSLHSLVVQDCTGFGGSSLDIVEQVCPNLQNIELSGSLQLSNAAILPLVETYGSGLVKVNLSGCADAVDDKIISILTRVHGGTLKVLNLQGCRKVTDRSILQIASNCYRLEDLDLSRTSITDHGISALVSAVHLHLQVLSLCGCSHISEKSFPFLRSLGPSILGLNLQNCYQMSDSSIRSLQNELTQCDILS